MAVCRETSSMPVCFVPANTAAAPVSLLEHISYEQGKAISHGYSTKDAPEVLLDLSTHMGGGVVLDSCVTCCCRMLYSVSGVQGIIARHWADQLAAAPHGDTAGIWTDFVHVNGAPDEVVTANTWALVDSAAVFPLTGSANPSGADQTHYTAWIYLQSSARFREVNGNFGERMAYYLDGQLVTQQAGVDTSATNLGLGDLGTIPAGVHRLDFLVSDLTSFSGVHLEWDEDGDNTFSLFPIDQTYSAPPLVAETPVTLCGTIISDGSSQLTFTPASNSWSPIDVAAFSAGASTAAGPSAQEIADAIVAKQRNVRPVLETFSGSAAQTLTVNPGVRGRIITVTEGSSGVVYMTIDGSVPSAVNGIRFSGSSAGGFDFNNVALSDVRILGSAAGSRYYIMYEVYL